MGLTNTKYDTMNVFGTEIKLFQNEDYYNDIIEQILSKMDLNQKDKYINQIETHMDYIRKNEYLNHRRTQKVLVLMRIWIAIIEKKS